MSAMNGQPEMERIPGQCDICTKPDGERDHNLQQCKVCSVLVHELCYGMVPTATKNPDFVCHACKAVGQEIVVNVPSRLGGWLLRDVLVQTAGAKSFREYLRGIGGKGDDDERRLDFYLAASDFYANKDEEGLFEEPLKVRAQNIFDTYCARDAAKKIDLSDGMMSEIEATIFDEDGSNIASDMFNAARQEVLLSLQKAHLGKYKQSATFKAHLASTRKMVKQEERPTQCSLCSVSTGVHAMHPLYDDYGREGRQLLLPATGVGFKRKEERLEWVHTLCAMFICASGRTGGLVYGCTADGDWEMPDDEDEEEESQSQKVIGNKDGSEEDPLQMEQLSYTKCEQTFEPLLERLERANPDNGDNEDVLACIQSMMDAVELLTVPFVDEGRIGLLVKKVKKSFEDTHPEVKARCKAFSANMKKVYYEKKEKGVPEGFKPIKHANAVDSPARGSPCDGRKGGGDDVGGEDAGTNGSTFEQKHPIGTAVRKEFSAGAHSGEVQSFNSTTGLYRVVYDDADAEDLDEAGVSKLMLSFTHHFCLAALESGEETTASKLLKEHQESLKCIVCNVADTGRRCNRIAVQCSAGDKQQFREFRQFTKKSLGKSFKEKGDNTCTVPMHVGCARWKSDYAKVNGRKNRMCYYFPGKPPTYNGPDGYTEPVANCFCRNHGREIVEGLDTLSTRKRKDPEVAEDSMNGHSNADDSDAKERKMQARKKKRVLDDSDDE